MSLVIRSRWSGPVLGLRWALELLHTGSFSFLSSTNSARASGPPPRLPIAAEKPPGVVGAVGMWVLLDLTLVQNVDLLWKHLPGPLQVQARLQAECSRTCSKHTLCK